jgi:hypothetical protein
MATINYTVSENVAAGYTLVEWAGMGAGDDGQIFDCSGLELASIQTIPSSGTMTVEGSNQISPANFGVIYSTGGQDMVGKSDAVSASRMRAIRPRTTGGGSVALFFAHR